MTLFAYSDLLLFTKEDEPGRCNVLRNPLYLQSVKLQEGTFVPNVPWAPSPPALSPLPWAAWMLSLGSAPLMPSCQLSVGHLSVHGQVLPLGWWALRHWYSILGWQASLYTPTLAGRFLFQRLLGRLWSEVGSALDLDLCSDLGPVPHYLCDLGQATQNL